MKEKDKTNKQKQDKQENSILLDHYIQRTITNKMQDLEDKALAEAIRSMLLAGDEETTTFH